MHVGTFIVVFLVSFGLLVPLLHPVANDNAGVAGALASAGIIAYLVARWAKGELNKPKSEPERPTHARPSDLEDLPV